MKFRELRALAVGYLTNMTGAMIEGANELQVWTIGKWDGVKNNLPAFAFSINTIVVPTAESSAQCHADEEPVLPNTGSGERAESQQSKALQVRTPSLTPTTTPAPVTFKFAYPQSSHNPIQLATATTAEPDKLDQGTEVSTLPATRVKLA